MIASNVCNLSWLNEISSFEKINSPLFSLIFPEIENPVTG